MIYPSKEKSRSIAHFPRVNTTKNGKTVDRTKSFGVKYRKDFLNLD